MRFTADSMKIDDDEGRFLLVIETDEGDRIEVNFHSIALEFEAEVRKELRPYALEAEHARATMAPSYDPADAYDPDDTKHPMFHALVSEMWDNRKGK
jgi:hypothetical protein